MWSASLDGFLRTFSHNFNMVWVSHSLRDFSVFGIFLRLRCVRTCAVVFRPLLTISAWLECSFPHTISACLEFILGCVERAPDWFSLFCLHSRVQRGWNMSPFASVVLSVASHLLSIASHLLHPLHHICFIVWSKETLNPASSFASVCASHLHFFALSCALPGLGDLKSSKGAIPLVFVVPERLSMVCYSH